MFSSCCYLFSSIQIIFKCYAAHHHAVANAVFQEPVTHAPSKKSLLNMKSISPFTFLFKQLLGLSFAINTSFCFADRGARVWIPWCFDLLRRELHHLSPMLSVLSKPKQFLSLLCALLEQFFSTPVKGLFMPGCATLLLSDVSLLGQLQLAVVGHAHFRTTLNVLPSLHLLFMKFIADKSFDANSFQMSKRYIQEIFTLSWEVVLNDYVRAGLLRRTVATQDQDATRLLDKHRHYKLSRR